MNTQSIIRLGGIAACVMRKTICACIVQTDRCEERIS